MRYSWESPQSDTFHFTETHGKRTLVFEVNCLCHDTRLATRINATLLSCQSVIVCILKEQVSGASANKCVFILHPTVHSFLCCCC